MQTRSGQAALEKKVGMLETHQREIHEALLSIENEAARLYQVVLFSPLNPSATCTCVYRCNKQEAGYAVGTLCLVAHEFCRCCESHCLYICDARLDAQGQRQ